MMTDNKEKADGWLGNTASGKSADPPSTPNVCGRCASLAEERDRLEANLMKCTHQILIARDEIARLRKDAAYHADCRPNRRQAEAAIADAKAMNDRWADERAARDRAEALLRERDVEIELLTNALRDISQGDERDTLADAVALAKRALAGACG